MRSVIISSGLAMETVTRLRMRTSLCRSTAYGSRTRSVPVGRAGDGAADLPAGFVLRYTGNPACELMAADELGRDFRVGLASEDGCQVELCSRYHRISRWDDYT
jgi:hypothetical protein